MDWELEVTGPHYADSVADGVKLYYTADEVEKLEWVQIYDFYGYEPLMSETETLDQKLWVVYNWDTEETLTDPFTAGTFTLSTYADLPILLLSIEDYIRYFTKIPVLLTTSDDGAEVRTPMWRPGYYPKSSTGYQQWSNNAPPKYLDGTNYWPA